MTTVVLYHNESKDHLFGYKPEHVVRDVFAFEKTSREATLDVIAEYAHRISNIDVEAARGKDERALVAAYRAQGCRSLSVGDVISVEVGDVRAWLAVASVGFVRLDAPPLREATVRVNVVDGSVRVTVPDATDTDFVHTGLGIRVTAAEVEPWGEEEFGMGRADSELAAMGWTRTGPWVEAGTHAWEAPVRPVVA